MKKIFLALALLISAFSQAQYTPTRTVVIPGPTAYTPVEGHFIIRGADGWLPRVAGISDINGLTAALAAKLDVGGNPYFSGQLRLGLNVTSSLFDGAGGTFTPQGIASHASLAGFAVYANDGVNNRRFGLFVDQTNGVVGLSQATGSTSLPFEYRNSTGPWFRIASNGIVRMHAYNGTAGFLKNGTDGTLSSVASIAQSEVTGLTASLTAKQDALSGTGFLKFVGSTPSFTTSIAQSEVTGLEAALLAKAGLGDANVFTALNTFDAGLDIDRNVGDAGNVVNINNTNGSFTGKLFNLQHQGANVFYVNRSGDAVAANSLSTATYLLGGNTALNYSTTRLRLGSGAVWTSGLSIEKPTRIAAVSGDPDASAMLDVSATTKGALLPRMSTSEKNAIASPAEGLIVFDATLDKYQYWNATTAQWTDFGTSGGGTVDASLADGSTNAIQNNAVYDKFVINDAAIAANTSALANKVNQVNNTAELTAVSTIPATPTAGNGAYYADNKFAKILAAFRGTNDNYLLQPHFSDGHISFAQVSNSATWTWSGAANVLSTGNAAATRAASLFGQQHRISYTTSTTAGAIAHMRNNGLYYYRGNAAGLGGWLWRQKGGVRMHTATSQIYMGFRSNGSAPTSVNPSGLTNICGFGKDATDNNWQFMVNDGSGSATKVDMGSSFPANTEEADWYTFTTYCPPNANVIYYHIRNEVTGAEASGNVTTNLPVNTTFLAWQNYVGNGSTAASAGMDWGTIYIETPY